LETVPIQSWRILLSRRGECDAWLGHETRIARWNVVWEIEIGEIETYFAFLPFAFSALIFADRAFAFRDILARTAADKVLLPLRPSVLLV
jgi:hypothetical protein